MECAREELTSENKNSRVMTFPRLQTLRVHEPRLSGPAEVVAQRRSGFLARHFARGHKVSGWKARPTQMVLRLSGPAEVVAQRRSGFLARRFARGHKVSGWKARPTQIVLRSHLATRRENKLSRTMYASAP
jgi:hypothetical protein